MGTRIEIAVWTGDRSAVGPALVKAFAEFDRIEQMASEWREGSELTRVNRAAGENAVVVSDELFALIQQALSWAERTDGAFDPTFAALWGLWTFGNDGVNRLPDAAEVERRRKLIDYRKVEIDEEQHSVFLPERGMKLGLGGIAKGYATDVVAKQLRAAGFADFVIKAGGELYAAGKRGDRAWRVGIQDPRGDDPFAALDLSDAAFDTSGDYERYFMADGARYHHIIDPATGYPARRSRSVTVLASTAMAADALSTALFVMGPERALALVESDPGLEAVIVAADNSVHVSGGLTDRLWIAHPPSP